MCQPQLFKRPSHVPSFISCSDWSHRIVFISKTFRSTNGKKKDFITEKAREHYFLWRRFLPVIWVSVLRPDITFTFDCVSIRTSTTVRNIYILLVLTGINISRILFFLIVWVLIKTSRIFFFVFIIIMDINVSTLKKKKIFLSAYRTQESFTLTCVLTKAVFFQTGTSFNHTQVV